MKDEVLGAIRFPENILKKNGKYYYQKKNNRGDIEVVCEKMGENFKCNNCLFNKNWSIPRSCC